MVRTVSSFNDRGKTGHPAPGTKDYADGDEHHGAVIHHRSRLDATEV
jgi:hypothetical protein